MVAPALPRSSATARAALAGRLLGDAMALDLTEIRALLASVAGFTEGPWRRDGLDVVPARPSLEGWQIADCGTSNSPDSAPYNADLIAAAPDLHRHLAEAVEEIERLRAHNTRMAAQINALADACEAAMSSEDGPLVVCDALPGRRWSECNTALRRLAAGEVDDV